MSLYQWILTPVLAFFAIGFLLVVSNLDILWPTQQKVKVEVRSTTRTFPT